MPADGGRYGHNSGADEALKETLRRVYERNPLWPGVDSRTRVGRLQRQAERMGLIVERWTAGPRFALTEKGKEFIKNA